MSARRTGAQARGRTRRAGRRVLTTAWLLLLALPQVCAHSLRSLRLTAWRLAVGGWRFALLALLLVPLSLFLFLFLLLRLSLPGHVGWVLRSPRHAGAWCEPGSPKKKKKSGYASLVSVCAVAARSAGANGACAAARSKKKLKKPRKAAFCRCVYWLAGFPVGVDGGVEMQLPFRGQGQGQGPGWRCWVGVNSVDAECLRAGG
eukprot:802555-Rhodomonas_salina.1